MLLFDPQSYFEQLSLGSDMMELSYGLGLLLLFKLNDSFSLIGTTSISLLGEESVWEWKLSAEGED